MAEKTGLCLSIQQPWAWLIVNGYKDIENRSWRHNGRGTIGIHAGMKFDREGYEFVRRAFPEIPMPEPHEFERGGIVGRAVLTDCVDEDDSPWFFGPYGFRLREQEPLPFRPCRGQLGFFRPEFTAPAAA